jgi:GNAT superfamily N-acetyltransferase
MADPIAVKVRFPEPADDSAPFEFGPGLAGKIHWVEQLHDHNPLTGRFTLVAERGGVVYGFATLQVRLVSLQITVLARNFAVTPLPGISVGVWLIGAASDLARSVGRSSVTLEALDEPALIAFYERNGFVRGGPPLFDAEWGVLHPMRMRLEAGVS